MTREVSRPFRTSWSTRQWIPPAGVPLVLGRYNEIGRQRVPAGVGMALGYGGIPGQDGAEGRLYVDLEQSPAAQIEGMVRFTLNDPQDRVLETLYEARTESLRAHPTDRTQQMPFPFIDAIATQDYSLVMSLLPDAAVTVAQATSLVLVEGTSFTAA